jgi:hypothetical protein
MMPARAPYTFSGLLDGVRLVRAGGRRCRDAARRRRHRVLHLGPVDPSRLTDIIVALRHRCPVDGVALNILGRPKNVAALPTRGPRIPRYGRKRPTYCGLSARGKSCPATSESREKFEEDGSP